MFLFECARWSILARRQMGAYLNVQIAHHPLEHLTLRDRTIIDIQIDRAATEGKSWVSLAALARTSFTLVGNEADRVREISACPAPRAARRLVKSPQCVRVNSWTSTR